MKNLAVGVIVLVMSLSSVSVYAAPPIKDEALYRHGRAEMILGVVALGVGTIFATASAVNHDKGLDSAAALGVAGVVGGTWFIWQGHKDIDRARRSAAFGFGLGRQRAATSSLGRSTDFSFSGRAWNP
jgi:hypothetical protein